jgi:hypothetical protein
MQLAWNIVQPEGLPMQVDDAICYAIGLHSQHFLAA